VPIYRQDAFISARMCLLTYVLEVVRKELEAKESWDGIFGRLQKNACSTGCPKTLRYKALILVTSES
jgi:hypothetical protein